MSAWKRTRTASLSISTRCFPIPRFVLPTSLIPTSHIPTSCFLPPYFTHSFFLHPYSLLPSSCFSRLHKVGMTRAFNEQEPMQKVCLFTTSNDPEDAVWYPSSWGSNPCGPPMLPADLPMLPADQPCSLGPTMLPAPLTRRPPPLRSPHPPNTLLFLSAASATLASRTCPSESSSKGR